MHGFQVDIDSLLNFDEYDIGKIQKTIKNISKFENKRIEPLMNNKLTKAEFDKVFDKVLNDNRYSQVTFQNLSICSSHKICKKINDDYKNNLPINAIKWLIENNQTSLRQMPNLFKEIMAAHQYDLLAFSIGSIVDLEGKDLVSCLLHFVDGSFVNDDRYSECISAILSVPLSNFASVSQDINVLFSEEKKIILLKIIKYFLFRKRDSSSETDVLRIPKKSYLLKWLSCLLNVFKCLDDSFVEVLSGIQKRLLITIKLSEEMRDASTAISNADIMRKKSEEKKLKNSYKRGNLFEMKYIKYI